MKTYFLLMTFLGLDYKGSQIQPGNIKTIQGTLEGVLGLIYRKDIHVHPVSRLDGGVSARRWGVSYTAEEIADDNHLIYVLNRALPKEIRVLDVFEANGEDSPRFKAEMKTYEYTVGLKDIDPLKDMLVWHPAFKFDKEIFKKTLSLFEGQHDFSCFYSSEKDEEESPFKIIDKVWTEEDESYLQVFIRGHAFGRYQIRYIVGSAFQVAAGKMAEQDILDMLSGTKKEKLAFKAPSNALVLFDVTYAEGYLKHA